MITITRRALALPLPIVLLALAAAYQPAAHTTRVAGTFTAKYSQQHPLLTGTPAEPMLLANEARGTNRNTGGTDYMDNGEITSVEIADLTEGSGSHQGYVTFAKDGERTMNAFKGRITTRKVNGQPLTTFEGNWTKVGGTGRYDGGRGSGRYRGRLLSSTEYEVQWEGEITLKEKTATR